MSDLSRSGKGHARLTVSGLLREMVNRFLMAGMNRLSPLIARRTGPWGPMLAYDPPAPANRAAAAWLDDLKLFATAWLGGVVFFGTLLS